ncbi:MAG: hypothetical protein JO345_32760 [Streptosporangiaceae bacterium]|nr:hypothetical protein [Streptosporangiaceae bacterium]
MIHVAAGAVVEGGRLAWVLVTAAAYLATGITAFQHVPCVPGCDTTVR